MTEENHNNQGYDIDPPETQEWQAALESVIRVEGKDRARFLLSHLAHYAEQAGVSPPVAATTAYKNTLAAETSSLDDNEEAQLQSLINTIRWNAIAMVLRAGKKVPEVGGHIATYASAAVLYEVGFNYFFRAPHDQHLGDLIYVQGHATPGIYARSYLEGRISEKQMDGFRQEINGEGLSSYPHPWLMPDYWQFPTVSMGLGPVQAIYQARFMKYLTNRGLGDHSDRKVWMFVGDGEMDEPESAGALHIAAKEGLDNLIFVVNCNLQRLDGLVRGDGKIIQELESLYRGAGWNVIKVIWGRQWDQLFAKDKSQILLKKLDALRDGDFQRFNVKGLDYLRKHLFESDPELKALIEHWRDEDLAQLDYGGHDPQKVYAAYDHAVNLNNGRPTVILAKTVKGCGMGASGESMNVAHQQKKMDPEDLKAFCERFQLPLKAQQIEKLAYYKPKSNQQPMPYLHERRKQLGGYLPKRPKYTGQPLKIPELSAFSKLLEGSGDREISTTMAFVRILGVLLKDQSIKERIVPIVPDEARTFGMEGLFRQIGIYSPVGQLYESYDQKHVLAYREAKDGQLFEEGITEAGSFSTWIAAATAYSTHNDPMIPFYIYYSMFGYQRTGDLAWASGDQRARGFLLGGTSGRTTLSGEGLQHQDGHNHVCFSMLPTCKAYDPTFGYELAVIIQDGLKRMYKDQKDLFYYITVMNENYPHPAMPKGVENGIVKGIYQLQKGSAKAKLRVQLLGSGAILNEVIKAAELLKQDFQVSADVWSVTSFSELRKDGMAVDRHNRLHPKAKPQVPYVTQCLKSKPGPAVAATDYVRLYADLIRPYVPQAYYVLGTDGFGRSDTRAELRRYFEVDARWIAYTAIKALADEGKVTATKVANAMKKYKIDPKLPDPWTR